MMTVSPAVFIAAIYCRPSVHQEMETLPTLLRQMPVCQYRIPGVIYRQLQTVILILAASFG